MSRIDWALAAEKAAVAAARENAPYVDCFPGQYERRHLTWDEYAASSAVDALDTAIIDELAKFDSLGEDYDFEFQKREKAIREVVDREFYDPYMRELRRLRPDLRECGDDGSLGSAGPIVLDLARAHGFARRSGRLVRWLAHRSAWFTFVPPRTADEPVVIAVYIGHDLVAGLRRGPRSEHLYPNLRAALEAVDSLLAGR